MGGMAHWLAVNRQYSHCSFASLTEAGDAGEHDCVADCEGHVRVAGMGRERILIRAPTGRRLLRLLGGVLQMMYIPYIGPQYSQLPGAVLNEQSQSDATWMAVSWRGGCRFNWCRFPWQRQPGLAPNPLGNWQFSATQGSSAHACSHAGCRALWCMACLTGVPESCFHCRST